MRLQDFEEEDWSKVVYVEVRVYSMNLMLEALSCLEASIPIPVIVFTGRESDVVFSISCLGRYGITWITYVLFLNRKRQTSLAK